MRFVSAFGLVFLVACPTSTPQPPDLSYGPNEEVLLGVGGWAMDDYGFFFPVSEHCLVVRVGDYGPLGSGVVLDASVDRWRISGSVARSSCDDARVAWNSLESPSSHVGDQVSLEGSFSVATVVVGPGEIYLRLSGELSYLEPWDGGMPRTVVLDRAIAWVLRPGP